MNLFIAGVHGVGKTYLASQVPAELGLVHTSASQIIRDELTQPNWDASKYVGNVNANQIALVTGLKRLNSTGKKVLLDGHFVLLNSSGDFVRLETSVFSQLGLKGVLLVEARPQLIAERVGARDGRTVDVGMLEKFLTIEREHATSVCDELGLALTVLREPTSEKFNATIVDLLT